MRLVRRPPYFTWLVFSLFIAPPVFLLNLWVMQKGSSLKLTQRDSLMLLGAQLAWVLLSVHWLLKARWRGFLSVSLLSGTMIVGNVYLLLLTKNYALAFYALFLLIMAGLYCFHLFRNLKEPFYRSGQRWFEGRPVFLPSLEAWLSIDGQRVPARLSRLGIEGCFAYLAPNAIVDTGKVEAIALKLGELTLDCAVELITKSEDGAGGGFRFLVAGADQLKDICDFIDRVRSSGYVS